MKLAGKTTHTYKSYPLAHCVCSLEEDSLLCFNIQNRPYWET